MQAHLTVPHLVAVIAAICAVASVWMGNTWDHSSLLLPAARHREHRYRGTFPLASF